MAKQTSHSLRNLTFYQVFVRQHSATQDFNGLIADLDRIKSLGVDVLYLLPIHPIGKKMRKGSKGSPYAVFDYYQIDENYGTMTDFDRLVEAVHQRDMKIMMDIVINHTAKDSVLTEKHPDWFYHKPNGEFANRVGNWSDITDLDYQHQAVWDYMINMLAYWAKHVDGFRCDVAPLLPIDFWMAARTKIDQINPELIWLSESVHPSFIKYLRDLGYDCSTDSQMYQAFDICYDYDIFEHFEAYLKTPSMLHKWMDEIYRQETTYPKNYVKLRSFENHDQARLHERVRDDQHFVMLVSLSFFLRGAAFIYAGMEHMVDHRPDLFEDDLIVWQPNRSIEPLIKKLSKLKKDPMFSTANFHMHNHDQAVVLSYENKKTCIVGIFNLENAKIIPVPLLDGTYTNLLDLTPVTITAHQITGTTEPIIIKTSRGNYQ